jgi:hypothetical protein
LQSHPTKFGLCIAVRVPAGPQPGSSIERNLISNDLPIPNELGTGGAPPNAVYHDNVTTS